MGGLERWSLVVATLVVGLGASFLIGRWWSPVCHEGCPGAIQASMGLFLLALPLAMAGVVALAAAKPRALARVGTALAAFAAAGVVLTLVAAWFQGHGHGG